MRALFAAALIIVLAACISRPEPSANCAGQAPERTLQAIIDADNARDLGAVMQLYTDDVVWLSPREHAPMRGRDAILNRYAALYESGEPRLRTEVVGVDAGDRVATAWGYVSGVIVSNRGGNALTEVNDVFTASLRCERGAWRVSVLMWRAR